MMALIACLCLPTQHRTSMGRADSPTLCARKVQHALNGRLQLAVEAYTYKQSKPCTICHHSDCKSVVPAVQSFCCIYLRLCLGKMSSVLSKMVRKRNGLHFDWSMRTYFRVGQSNRDFCFLTPLLATLVDHALLP